MIIASKGLKSKKRSDASSNSKPPKPLVFFIDRSLGKEDIAAALRQAGVEVHVHDDHFPKDARDQDWLLEVGRKGWIVLTKDKKIRYRVPALVAFKKARVLGFVLTRGNLQGPEMAEIFVKALPAINRFVAKHSPPFIAKVTRKGTVSMLFGTK